jgi:hypothetical protein
MIHCFKCWSVEQQINSRYIITYGHASLTKGIRSEKYVLRRFHHCANIIKVYLHKPRQYSIAYYTPRLYSIAYCS